MTKRTFTDKHKKNISKSSLGRPAWNKGKNKWMSKKSNKRRIEKMKGKRYSPNTEFKKGMKALNPFKKGYKPWNYIDGRSKGGGTGRYGSDWVRMRKVALIRDNFSCQFCGNSECRLEVHHKIPFMLSRDNSLENLVTLCSKCHKNEEVRIMKELKKQGDE